MSWDFAPNTLVPDDEPYQQQVKEKTMPQQYTPKPYVPSYKFANVAMRDKFLDLVDVNPPQFCQDIFPTKDDRNVKHAFTFTAVTPNGTLFFRMLVGQTDLLRVLHQMCLGMSGDPGRNNSMPGFPLFRGSPDKRHPEWQYVSRSMDIQYITHIKDAPLRQGPSYALKFTYGEGRVKMSANGTAGIVTPANNGTEKSASILLPIYGNKDMPPLGMNFPYEALHYLNGRESLRLMRMAFSVDNLRYQALTDPAAHQRYDDLFFQLNGYRREEPQQVSMTQEQAQQGYQQLVQGQQNYVAPADQEANPLPHYDQLPYPYGAQEAAPVWEQDSLRYTQR